MLGIGEPDFTEARFRNLLIGFEMMLTPMLRDLTEARLQHIAILEQCVDLVEKAKLKPHVSRQFPLKEAQSAHETIETGHTQGKIALHIADL